ncbi:hypothetical protein LY76DRAFT_593119 [Colletotrichum caudatum]|nr:hypothetical protein LY76DRAFT_593119 [Colletotrichum caudatum]
MKRFLLTLLEAWDFGESHHGKRGSMKRHAAAPPMPLTWHAGLWRPDDAPSSASLAPLLDMIYSSLDQISHTWRKLCVSDVPRFRGLIPRG